jgi:hypothetical protein
MRRPLLFATALLLTLPTAEASAQTAPPRDEKGSDKINDGDRALDTMENIATKPLKDLNIVKKKIPPELEAMMDEPYSLKGLRTCRQYAAEIDRIDELIGPDVDSEEALGEKKQTASEFTFSAVEAVAGSLIPFSGLVRMISGAQKRERYAQAAVFAGAVRRSFLKGTARAKGCRVA